MKKCNARTNRIQTLEITIDLLRFRLQMTYQRRKPLRKQIKEIQDELDRLKHAN